MRIVSEVFFRGLGLKILCLLYSLAPSQVYAQNQISVVYIQVTKEATDFQSPWQNQSSSVESHLGVVVDGGDVLTTSFAISDAKAIEVQSFGESHKHRFEVILDDPEVNLALIRASEQSVADSFSTRQRLKLGPELAVPSDGSVDCARSHDRLSEVRARLVEVNQGSLFTSYSVPIYSLELSRGLRLGWSEPVLANDRLVGLTMGTSQDNLRVLPASIINLFLQRAKMDEYPGFVGLALRGHMLIDPVARQRLGVGEFEYGILVDRVLASSPLFGLILPEDVVVGIGEHRVNATGSFAHPVWGNHPISYLSNTLTVGEKVTISFYRNGEFREEGVGMTRFDSTRNPIPTHHLEEYPYLIVGGLLFQELSLGFLRSFGNDWQNRAPLSLLHSWFHNNDPSDDPEERVVFLNRVLADEVNRGYHPMRYAILESVDGVEIKNLAHLRSHLDSLEKEQHHDFIKARFLYGQGEVILSRSAIKQANDRISQTYGLPLRAMQWPLAMD